MVFITVRYFRTYASQEKWLAANTHRYQVTVLDIQNRYAVEYRQV